MDSSYVAVGRQSGLLNELRTVANNIANISTTGYRKEGVVFAEYVDAIDVEGGSVSLATARARFTDSVSGGYTQTGGALDFAISGPGFFMIETPNGNRLTRAGNFSVNPDGEMVTLDGYKVLDTGGAPLFVPQDGGEISVAEDGTVSSNGNAIGQVGIFEALNPQDLIREDGVMFQFNEEPLVAENSAIKQGFLEGSNVNPIEEIARLIEVQRAYELGQKLAEREDERLRGSIRTIGRGA